MHRGDATDAPVEDEFASETADEKRIRQILGEAIWLAFQEVKDPVVQAWICDELTRAAQLAPIATNCPVSLTRH